MARIRFSKLDEYTIQLSRLSENSEAIAAAAVYEGAAIITDAIRESIENLSASSDKAGLMAYQKKEPAPLTETAKQGLLDGLGITPMKNEQGYLNVKIGFDGYNNLASLKYPHGQPNQMIARSLEFGSSIAPKRPFIRPAVNANRKRAEARMAEIFDRGIKKIME